MIMSGFVGTGILEEIGNLKCDVDVSMTWRYLVNSLKRAIDEYLSQNSWFEVEIASSHMSSDDI